MQEKALGPITPKKQTYVQTERKAHMALGRLGTKQPSAAAILNTLIAIMDKRGAVCISHQTIAKMLDIHLTTVKKAMKTLRDDNWIQQIQLGKSGTVNVYVISSQVAWADYRNKLHLAAFSARIIADAEDQSPETLIPKELRKIPLIHPPEEALPTGEWPKDGIGYLEGLEPTAEGYPQQTDIEDFT